MAESSALTQDVKRLSHTRSEGDISSNNGSFFCCICKPTAYFTEKRTLLRHKRRFHPDADGTLPTTEYKCNKCQRKFSRKDNLSRHVKSGCNAKTSCTICTKKVSRRMLQAHQETRACKMLRDRLLVADSPIASRSTVQLDTGETTSNVTVKSPVLPPDSHSRKLETTAISIPAIENDLLFESIESTAASAWSSIDLSWLPGFGIFEDAVQDLTSTLSEWNDYTFNSAGALGLLDDPWLFGQSGNCIPDAHSIASSWVSTARGEANQTPTKDRTRSFPDSFVNSGPRTWSEASSISIYSSEGGKQNQTAAQDPSAAMCIIPQIQKVDTIQAEHHSEGAQGSNSWESANTNTRLPSFTALDNSNYRIRSRKCSACNSHFSRRSTLLRHHRTMHSRRTAHTCSRCGESFSRNDILARHMDYQHNEHKIECIICGRMIRSSALHLHWKSKMCKAQADHADLEPSAQSMDCESEDHEQRVPSWIASASMFAYYSTLIDSHKAWSDAKFLELRGSTIQALQRDFTGQHHPGRAEVIGAVAILNWFEGVKPPRESSSGERETWTSIGAFLKAAWFKHHGDRLLVLLLKDGGKVKVWIARDLKAVGLCWIEFVNGKIFPSGCRESEGHSVARSSQPNCTREPKGNTLREESVGNSKGLI